MRDHGFVGSEIERCRTRYTRFFFVIIRILRHVHAELFVGKDDGVARMSIVRLFAIDMILVIMSLGIRNGVEDIGTNHASINHFGDDDAIRVTNKRSAAIALILERLDVTVRGVHLASAVLAGRSS